MNSKKILIICGPSRSGKSILSKYISKKYGYFHIEASDFMWLKYHEIHGIKSDIKIGDFAKDILKENPSIITDQILDFIKKRNLHKIIISGFRSEKEIEFVKNWNYNFLDIEEVYIDAPIKIRFEREREKNRIDSETTFERFQIKDFLQFSMGLKIISNNIVNRIDNESTKESFYSKFDRLMLNKLGND